MIRVPVANKLPDAPAILTDHHVIPWALRTAIAAAPGRDMVRIPLRMTTAHRQRARRQDETT